MGTEIMLESKEYNAKMYRITVALTFNISAFKIF